MPNAPAALFSHVASLQDPRLDRTKRHELLDILVVALCAVICGAGSWVEVEEFGKAKAPWLKQFLRLPNGIPSHDTFGRVFALLDPRAFQECFLAWIRSVSEMTQGEVGAIDGKTLRRSFDRAVGKHALHLISAWACRNRLVLGQLKTDEHSNEIPAIPPLLRLLDVAGCLVTIDALGTQTQIAQAITAAGADYVLTLKANHATVFEEVRLFLDDWAQTHPPHETGEKDHGRLEVRRAWLVDAIDWFPDKAAWAHRTSFGRVEAHRTLQGQTQTQRRYYLSSLPATAVARFAAAVRSHWQIENALHWSLDVTFHEDHSRVRKDHAPENLAILRCLALSLLKRETSCHGGLKVRRLRAACDHAYVAEVLLQKI